MLLGVFQLIVGFHALDLRLDARCRPVVDSLVTLAGLNLRQLLVNFILLQFRFNLPMIDQVLMKLLLLLFDFFVVFDRLHHSPPISYIHSLLLVLSTRILD